MSGFGEVNEPRTARAHINEQKEDKRTDRTNTRRIRGSFSHRCRSPRQPAKWLLQIILAHCLSSCPALLLGCGFWKDNCTQRVCKSWQRLLNWSFCMMWLHWPTVSWQMRHFAYFCCGRVETEHSIYLWLNSPHEPSHRWERCSHSDFAFCRGTHFKITIWALHCSGFTVWIKFKQAHANTESPLTLFCTDKLCHGRCVEVQ